MDPETDLALEGELEELDEESSSEEEQVRQYRIMEMYFPQGVWRGYGRWISPGHRTNWAQICAQGSMNEVMQRMRQQRQAEMANYANDPLVTFSNVMEIMPREADDYYLPL